MRIDIDPPEGWDEDRIAQFLEFVWTGMDSGMQVALIHEDGLDLLAEMGLIETEDALEYEFEPESVH